MKLWSILLILMTTSNAFAQPGSIGKIYVVEGVVADRETLKALPLALLYNDSLGITTTSDENGYFKIVVPHTLIESHKHLPITIIKNGYKKLGSGIGYNSGGIGKDSSEQIVWEL